MVTLLLIAHLNIGMIMMTRRGDKPYKKDKGYKRGDKPYKKKSYGKAHIE
jgi:hypothetical protein